jgi:hypothetical protein
MFVAFYIRRKDVPHVAEFHFALPPQKTMNNIKSNLVAFGSRALSAISPIRKALLIPAAVLVAASAAPNLFAAEPVFTGGVSGIADLSVDANSNGYRARGGNLYLHHSGWAPASNVTKDNIEALFAGKQIFVELGYGDADAAKWTGIYKGNYRDRGVNANYITSNCFSSDRIPTLAGWNLWIKTMRDSGVKARLYPTFEYANFGPRASTLSANYVSRYKGGSVTADMQRSKLFQDIIRASGGCVIDSPPGFYFAREATYRTWVRDCIKWTKGQGLTAVVIVSPHTSGTNYDEDAKRFVDDLAKNSAAPNIYCVENYSTQNPSTYVNRVGTEDTAHHQLGLGLWFAKRP